MGIEIKTSIQLILMSYSSFYIRRAMKCSFCNIIGHLQYRNYMCVYHDILNTLNQTYLISSISYLRYLPRLLGKRTNCETYIYKNHIKLMHHSRKILSWLISSSSVKLGDYSMNQQNSSEWQENTSTWVSVLFVCQCNANHVPKDTLNISYC